jgi:transcriptional regulator with XRE-family HTH domain
MSKSQIPLPQNCSLARDFAEFGGRSTVADPMAKELNISPSYVNLIEQNQRPVTAQILPADGREAYDVDLKDPAAADKDRFFAELNEVFSDPSRNRTPSRSFWISSTFAPMPQAQSSVFTALIRHVSADR